MKKRLFSLLISALLFLSLLPIGAFAEVMELVPEKGSLPAALNAKDPAAVKKALAGDFGNCGVIVDMKTFNALIVAPAADHEDMYAQMGDMEHRLLIGFYENPHADEKAAAEKSSRSFYYSPEEGSYKTAYPLYLALDLSNLKLPEREESEFDPILDKALFVREPGFYDVHGKVCSACGSYTEKPEEHIVLPCGVHMRCFDDLNDITHYSVCYQCRRMKCACYCNDYAPNGICLVIGGSEEYAVAGTFPEGVALSFDKDAKLDFIDKDHVPVCEQTPRCHCEVCGKELDPAAAVSLNCSEHYTCPGCFGKLGAKELGSHQTALECGHFSCDGKKHSTEIFSENCTCSPKHHKCEGVEPKHFCPACEKEFSCEDALLHSSCYVCGRPLCTGMHADCEYCGGRWCDGCWHGPGSCC